MLNIGDEIIAYTIFRDDVPNGDWLRRDCEIIYEVLKIKKENKKFFTLENGDKIHYSFEWLRGFGNKNFYNSFEIFSNEELKKVQEKKERIERDFLNSDIETTISMIEKELNYKTKTKILITALEKLLEKAKAVKTERYKDGV